jgi:hypothetical protein
MSPLNMDMKGALGLEFTDPFDLDGFTFNADNFLSESSDMSSILSPLECATLSNLNSAEGQQGSSEASS